MAFDRLDYNNEDEVDFVPIDLENIAVVRLEQLLVRVILSVDSIKFPLTGIGRYTYELARRLQLVENVNIEFLGGSNLTEVIPKVESLESTKRTYRRKYSYHKNIKPIIHKVVRTLPGSGVLYRGVLHHRQAKVLNLQKDFIFHGTNFYLPRCSGPKAVTIHDLSVFKWPDCHPPERVRVVRHHIQNSVKSADIIVTVSEFVRDEVIDYFRIESDRVRAVYNGVSPEFHPRNDFEINQCLAPYSLQNGRYALFTGTVEPRKNVSDLLSAYESLPEKQRLEYPLVISGFKGWRSTKIHERMEKAEKEGWLRYLGFVSDDKLPVLFAGARLFIFPSRYEGFGLPLLEAMASGVPAICSNTSSLPEVGGQAVMMFAPGDVDALAELIVKGLEDTDWRDQAKMRGLELASSFSWERCAKETIQVYKSIA